ncbi:beta-microseminoprotein-like [Phyllopteryx taeniolatus]|uniref:beta-microseminoprotein-like n=1 Tax=Phyllopteryx taeniolatus TaxID=161469 RepID=UPI002AD2A09F|nr:beta-microseminoprotein-like [Phyllopteryx taeniolatus]
MNTPDFALFNSSAVLHCNSLGPKPLFGLLRLTATMRTYLCVASLICAVLSLANGHCFLKQVEPGATDCFDEADNKRYPVGSSWRNSECMDCTCSSCCAAYGTPTRFPDDCVSVFDKAACKYRVHKIDDPSVECPIFGAVGK